MPVQIGSNWVLRGYRVILKGFRGMWKDVEGLTWVAKDSTGIEESIGCIGRLRDIWKVWAGFLPGIDSFWKYLWKI